MTDQILERLARNRARLLESVVELDDDALNQKHTDPDGGTWTIRDVLTHVLNAEEDHCRVAAVIARGELDRLPTEFDLDAHNAQRLNERGYLTRNELFAAINAQRQRTIALYNGLDEARNTLVRADCLAWLEQAERAYDLILLDPPSFSNSSAMDGSFDVQRDHAGLVRAAMRVLREGGRLYFSNNRRGFRLDTELVGEFHCEDITDATLGPDFRRNRKVHCCWSIAHRSASTDIEPAENKGLRR